MMDRMRAWWVAGVVAVTAAWLLSVVVQVVASDPFPPKISVSQYGVGPHGWLFSLWVATVVAAPWCLYLYRPVRGFGARWALAVGVMGGAVMAIVRTDAGGLQRSAQAKVHLVGSVMALSGVPIGILLCLLGGAAIWLRTAFALVGLASAALALLLMSAAGWDTTGAGPATSWAFWQSIALIADLLLLVLHAFGVLTVPPEMGDPEPWWTPLVLGGAGGAVRVSAHRPRTIARRRAAV
jgi:hypothetical protein